ncbi:hypothetical protein NQ314_006782 [Rhamnusium bicolor]|uniref:Uncharacterized protein n=1 Tax=Rhamnusium bicolor TaxID=1586634 RepID=A0AAV8YWK3_9CUCU|nr:hypothetical protein NQ314_006782 [Rhamnusium bicolor]
MSKVDMELKKAFIELQEKQIETTQKLRIADIQIENLKRSKQHASITEREINSLEDVKENLKTKQNSAEEKIKLLENSKAYLENSLKEATNSLRELVQTKKEA